ncbi:MAG TPA: hypothetical protein VIF60_15785, partial [Burkholderiaceae bacterium]
MPAQRKYRFAGLATALLVLLMFLQISARADYPPRAQAADMYFHDWTYGASSPDRHWVAYSSNAQLVVVDTTGASADRRFKLPKQINGLAIANDGRRLAVVRTDDTVALIDLSKTTPGNDRPNVNWTPLASNCALQGKSQVEPDYPVHLPPQPVTLSGDGRYLAAREFDCDTGTYFIRVSDVTTRAAPKALPVADGNDVGSIEFVDGDSKLAVFGEQIHALWDLRTGALQNGAYFGTGAGGESKFATAFDRATGEAYLSGENGRVARVDLGDCSKPVTSSTLPATERILAVSAGNTWYAVADGTKIDIFLAAGNKRLARFEAAFDVAFVAQGGEPGTVIAVSRTKKENNPAQGAAVMPREARHAIFHLPEDVIPALNAPQKKPWPPCRLLDEAAGARNVDRAAPPALRQTEIGLHGCGPGECGNAPTGKPFDGCSFDHSYAAWGRAEHGEIWIDHCSDIVRVDPHTGAVLEKLATPRNGKFVAITWFERSGFLNWQGDTVTFRSFHGERKVLASKPGWRVLSAFIEGSNTFGVLWAQNKFFDTNKGVPHKLGPMGSGLAVRYDFDTLHVLAQINAAALTPYENLPTQQDELVFDPDSFDTETEDAPPSALSVRAEPFIAANFHRTSPQAAPGYRWEQAIFDSVRLLTIPASGQSQAVLWDGLTAWPGKIAAARPRTIFDFGDAKAAVVRWNG